MPITKPDTTEYTPHFETYISKVTQDNLIDALKASSHSFLKLMTSILKEKHDYRYAPGKWTIKEMVAHIIDCERVFMYRGLSFARNDKNPLPGFNENEWAKEADVSNRSMDSLLEEYEHARKANIIFFEGISDEISKRKGKANNNYISVRALGFIISGHELHHMGILKERYL